MNKVYHCRFLAGLLTLLPVTVIMSGCATNAHDPGRPMASDPVPENLHMIILPGAEQSKKSLMFKTVDTDKSENAGEARKPDQTQIKRVREVEPSMVPVNEVVTEAEADLVFAEPSETPEILEGQRISNIPVEIEQGEEACSGCSYVDYKSSVSMHIGYRRDNMKWSIAGVGGSPNILSELKWEDLESTVLSVDFRWSDDSMAYIRGSMRIGWIWAGENQDSDYLGNNRTMEFSRSNNDAEGGGQLDASAGLGYRFSIPLVWDGGKIHLMPLAGYSYNSLDLEMTHGRQTLSGYGYSATLGTFDDLDSRYTAQWRGPWLGVDGEFEMNASNKLFASFEYHWAEYEGEGDWNLRSDFNHPVSFIQKTDGDGMVFSFGYQYQPSSSWLWRLFVDYQKWDSDPGEDITYFSDGTTGQIGFNGVEWDAYSINFGVGYSF
jgi:Protochlamydia outer membrane protein